MPKQQHTLYLLLSISCNVYDAISKFAMEKLVVIANKVLSCQIFHVILTIAFVWSTLCMPLVMRAHIVLHKVLLVRVLAINKPTSVRVPFTAANKFDSMIQFGRVCRCGFVWPSCGFQKKWLVNKVLLFLFILNGYFSRSFKHSFELGRYNDTYIKPIIYTIWLIFWTNYWLNSSIFKPIVRHQHSLEMTRTRGIRKGLVCGLFLLLQIATGGRFVLYLEKGIGQFYLWTADYLIGYYYLFQSLNFELLNFHVFKV